MLILYKIDIKDNFMVHNLLKITMDLENRENFY